MARIINPNITDEQRARKREAQKRWLEKKKAESEATSTSGIEAAPDYKKLYLDTIARNKTLENQVIEYEKLCKSYVEKERQTAAALQRATIEYNARVKYMLECVRHAQISMQFASMATDKKEGGNQ